MQPLAANPAWMRMLAIGLVTLIISALFIGMVWDFLVALFLAAVFSAMASPLHRRVLSLTRRRRGIAAAATLLLLIVGVLLPGLVLLNVIVVQANELAADVMPWIKQQLSDPSTFKGELPEWVPYREQIAALGPQLSAKVGELAATVAGFLVDAAADATRGTARFLLSLFIMLYAMFFFLQEQTTILDRLMRYTALPAEAQQRLVERAVSVSRATIKGTLVVGLVQGMLGGIGFAVAGISGAVFWATVMAVASVLPAVGPALVWVPAVVYLLITGQTGAGIGLALWGGLVVGTIDNVLRPRLVGGDTQMPDILILVSTLGGLAMFGAIGLIIGPVIGGLFVTMWDIFRLTFAQMSPQQSAEEN